MDLGQALETYTVLTIGDGLVTVIPALMISISGGLIVTRASSDDRLGTDFSKQLFGVTRSLCCLPAACWWCWPSSPGCRPFRFLAMGSGLGFAAWQMTKKQSAAQAERRARRSRPRRKRISNPCCAWNRLPSRWASAW